MEKLPVEKNKEYIVDIIDNGFEGEGVAKIDNYTIFIPSTIQGEKCKIVIVKVLPSHAYGKIIEIIEKSQYRTKEDCNTYKRCGGCNLRHIDYTKTLKMKQEIVQNLIDKNFKNSDNDKVKVELTLGMNNPFYYRNKAQYPFGYDKNRNKIVGIYAERTHEIIEMDGCKIQQPITEEIANCVLEFIKKYNIDVYDEKVQKRAF